MKKAIWLASAAMLTVAAWATTASVPVQANGSYAIEQINGEEQLVRRGGSNGGSSYGSSGGRRQRNKGYGSSGGGRRSRGSHGSRG